MSDKINQYSVLGLDIKLDESESGSEAERVIERFKLEISQVKELKPNLKDHEVAVLIGLDLMKKFMAKESEYKESLMELQADIKDAISFLSKDQSPSITQ